MQNELKYDYALLRVPSLRGGLCHMLVSGYTLTPNCRMTIQGQFPMHSLPLYKREHIVCVA